MMTESSRFMEFGSDQIATVAYRLAGAMKSWSDPKQPDRRKLAVLRRGLADPDGWDIQLATVVNPLLEGVPPNRETIFYQVAALYGLHPVPWITGEQTEDRPNRAFTTSLHRYAVSKAPGGGKALDEVRKPLDRRVMALLNADSEDVFHHLRHVVRLLRNSDIPVHWAQLMIDLHQWDYNGRPVQRRWSRAWWPAPDWLRDRNERSGDTAGLTSEQAAEVTSP